MTAKVGLEIFWDFHSIFVVIYKTDRAKRFLSAWIVNEPDCGSVEKFVGT